MIAALVLVAAAAAPAASAQDVGDLEPSDFVEESAELEAGDDADADEPHTPYNDNHAGLSFVLPDAQPGDGDSAGGTGGGDVGLALTGTDVEPIIAMSAGLLAVGGAALVASRRRLSLFD